MARPRKIRPPKTHDRAWGEGTVKALTGGRYRAWRARVKHPDGTSTRASQTFSGADAEQRAKAWAKGDPQSSVMYLGQWLEIWLNLRRPTLDPSTYDLYRRAVDVCAPLAHRPLAQLVTDDWQALANTLLGRWSRYHVLVWRGNISTALRAAMPEHIQTNPITRVKLPTEQEEPPTVWRQDEVDRLLTAAIDSPHEAWLLFLLGVGVRLGESRALLWADVDQIRKTATIRASLDNATAKRGPTKTRRVRIVDVPEDVMAAMSDLRKRQPITDALVFGHDGRPYACSTLRIWLTRLCKRAGVTPLSPHAARHTYASLALDAGVPIQDVARQLGHTVETCQRTYAHFIGDGMRRAANALQGALRHRFSGPKRGIGTQNGTSTGG